MSTKNSDETDRKINATEKLLQILHLNRGRDMLGSMVRKMQGLDDMGDTSVHIGDVFNPAKGGRVWPALAAAVLGAGLGAGALGWALSGDEPQAPADTDTDTLYDLGFVD